MPLHVLFCSSVIPYEKEKFASSYLLITVKDNSLVGGGVFLGEALLPLSEVKESSIDQNLAELPQIQLPLTKPSRDQGRPNLLLRGKEIRLLCFLQFEPVKRPGVRVRTSGTGCVKLIEMKNCWQPQI